MTRVFFDFEFTGLRQDTTPISLGMISEDGIPFYAEFTDFNKTMVDNWVLHNVIPYLELHNDTYSKNTIIGDKEIVTFYIKEWLMQFEQVEMWGDHLAYDWVLLCQLFGGGAECLPRNVYYIPFDICTLFKCIGIDPDVNRIEFSGFNAVKHHALNDARIIRSCYNKARERENW